MTLRDPEHSRPIDPREQDARVDLFNCRSCRRFTNTLIPGRGWCSRDGSPKLIEVRSYMKHCWQARRP
ncbi:MAG TPA: hypothetical protein VFV59_07935 [Candidatus Limnocylindria bacterium]|nr:hypothetical protein [Candidatus Limnocylindria bacterium]